MKHSCLRLVLALVALLSSAAGLAAADSWSSQFDAANKLYEEGKYAQAITAYQRIADAGLGAGPLYFNLGNACFKSGELGRAIAAYRQAERLTPRDPDLQANLQFVRNQVQGPTAPPRRWKRWLDTLTLNEWTLVTSAALWLWMLPLTSVQIRPAWRPALRPWILAGGYATAISATCLELAWSASVQRTAVLTVNQAAVHNGPLDESPTAFAVHDGAELEVLDQKDDWYQVTLGDRRVGWIRRNQVLVQPAAWGGSRKSFPNK